MRHVGEEKGTGSRFVAARTTAGCGTVAGRRAFLRGRSRSLALAAILASVSGIAFPPALGAQQASSARGTPGEPGAREMREAPGTGEAPEVPAGVGTLLVAHGGGPGWNAGVLEVAREVETGGPVEVSFLMGAAAGEHRFQDAVRRLREAGAAEIVVVPLLVSSHSGHYEQVRWLAGETDTLSERLHHHLARAGIDRPEGGVPLRLAGGLDDAPELVRVLVDRALALAEDPSRQALFLVGHGPTPAEDHALWMEKLRPVARAVGERAGFADVKVGLLRDDAAVRVRAEAVRRIREIVELQHRLTGREVVVVPILLSEGRINREKLPADLEGLPVRYGPEPLLPHPAVARWIERRVSELATRSATEVGGAGG